MLAARRGRSRFGFGLSLLIWFSHSFPFTLSLWLSLPFWLAGSALAATPFVNEVADGSANTVGWYTSLALDAQGNPHVGYQDLTAGDLKYARKSSGVWTTETADGSANTVGWYTSFALDALGNPHVSYQDATTGDLKYARKSSGVWTTETADASANDLGYYTSLALDAQGNPHVSYYDNTTLDLKYARKSGGVWTTETADGSANNVGAYTSLALDAQGNPHVSYRDATTFDLKYARKSGGVWTTETADASANNVGWYTSLALDAQGNPHVSHHDNTTGDFKYARKSGGVWTTETADGSANSVGWYTSLALDVQGNPHVSYLDATTFDPKYARKSGGVWTTETADASANDVGLYTSLALDAQGNPHVSYYDNTTGDLKYADAAVHAVGPTAGVTWAVGSEQLVTWSGVGTLDILLSVDGGASFYTLLESITASPVPVRVPHTPTRFARIRLRRETPFSTADTDSFFTIDAAIALLKFDAAAGSDGRAVTLTWKTEPGPDADVRYRIERAAGSGAFAPTHAGLLDRAEYTDHEAGVAARYRLIAVNGLGEEYVLGETAPAAALGSGRALIVTPNPSPGGFVRALYRVSVDFPETDLAVYDASGRRVRTLVSGSLPAGLQSATWDGRDGSGRPVSAGIYFLRLTWGGLPRDTERVTVIR